MFRPNVKLVLEPGAGARIVDEQSQRTLTLTPTEGRILALMGPGATAQSLTAAARGAGIDIETKQIEALLARLAANAFVDYTPSPEARSTQAPLLPDDVVPAFRTDLRIAPAPKPGLMLVTDKKRDRSFTLYDFEVHIARLLDGHHTVARVIELAAKIGMPVTPESLGKFIGQMKAYGFIQEGVLAPRASAAAASDTFPARAQWSTEIRELYQSALRQFRAGRPGHAIEYLDALLEIQPDTPEAAELKKRVQQHLESGPVMELSFEDLHGVDDPMPDLVAASEPLLGGRTLQNPVLTPVVATDGVPATSPMAKTVVTPRLPVPPPAPDPPPAPEAPPKPAPTSLLEPEPFQIAVSAPRRSAPIFPPKASAPLPAPRPSTPRLEEPEQPKPSAPIFGKTVPGTPDPPAMPEPPLSSAPIWAKTEPASPVTQPPKPSAPIFAKPRPSPVAPLPGDAVAAKPEAAVFPPRTDEPRPSPVAPPPKAQDAIIAKPEAPPRPSAPIFAKPRPSPLAPPSDAVFPPRSEEPRPSPVAPPPKTEDAIAKPEAPPRPSAPIYAKPRPSPLAPPPGDGVIPKPEAPVLTPQPPPKLEEPPSVRPSAPVLTPPVEEPRASEPVVMPKADEAPPARPSAPIFRKTDELPKPRSSAPVLTPRTDEPRPSAPVLTPKTDEPPKPRSSAPVLTPKTEEPPKAKPSAPVFGKTAEPPKVEEPPPPEPSVTVSDDLTLPPDSASPWAEKTNVAAAPTRDGVSPLDSRRTEVMPPERTELAAAPASPAVTEPDLPAAPSAPRRPRASAPRPAAEESAPAPRPSRPKPGADGAVPDAPIRVRRSQPQVPKAQEPAPKRTALYAGIGAAVALAALAFPIPATQRIDVQLVATPKTAPKFPAGAFGRLEVQSGAHVEQGAVIATLDVSKQKAEKEELAKTITRLDQAAQRALAKANPAATAKAKQNVAKAKTELAKARAGVAKSKDRAKAELDVARKEAALERAERLLVAADGTEKAKQLKLEATAARERSAKLQQQIDRAVVTAPATGVFELDALPPAGANFDEGTEFGRIVAPQLLVQGAPADAKDPVLISGENRIALFTVDKRPEGLTVPFERGLKPGPAVLEVPKGYRPWPIALLSR